jgi:hypothetical protein
MGIKNNRGQMAIFVALFFQVIFIFFAMAINVGLVVHDKINLQSAVDMAAYYGAMKQGEVLNQIAHINYQMRQNYKLFAWRHRVLGTLGNQNHPLSYWSWNGGNQTLFDDEASSANGIKPTVCVFHSVFAESVALDPDAASICKQDALTIPAVPSISAPSGLVPGSSALPGTFDFIQDQLDKYCLEAGIFNWLYAARILAHFRVDGLHRKKMIWKLAENLTGPSPLDLKGESIEQGVRNTFEKNLTNTNFASIKGGSGQFFFENSLSKSPCDKVNFWLPEIRIRPVVYYSDWDNDPGGGCPPATAVPNVQGATRSPASVAQGLDNLPYAFSKGGPWDARLNSGLVQRLIPHWAGEPGGPTNQPTLHSSVGFEKNPWCMIYSGVQAQTTVRKPFDPTGSGVVLQARGFAKPFGGRIGPWYGKTWQRGAAHSKAQSRSERVDPLLPTRAVTGGPAPSSNPNEEVSNYSRYPGDEFGVGSMQAMSAMIQPFMTTMNHFNKDMEPPLAIATYDHLGGTPTLGNTKDSLAREAQVQGRSGVLFNIDPKQRNFELGAVAPDVFDALYYSIEPKNFELYFHPQATNDGANFSEPDRIYDFGSSGDNYSYKTWQAPENFNVINQINEIVPNVYQPDYNHVIRDWENLLTSWHQKRIVDYSFDDARFGDCQEVVSKPQYPTTGNCIVGGRTGYSVKLISNDYLKSGDHSVGGSSAGGGSILNPPSF